MLRKLFGFGLVIIIFYSLVLTSSAVGKEIKRYKPISTVLTADLDLDKLALMQTSYIYDNKKQLISERNGVQKRVYLPIPRIPKLVKNIFIAIEDRHFYEHEGIDIQGVMRAVVFNAKSQSASQGGSTITQQLTRTLFLTQQKTLERKVNEVLYSYQLEKQLSKDHILELYINAIYFQNGVYGVEAASAFYFNTSVDKLSIAETAFVCAIPNNPTLYDPFTRFSKTKKRQERILKQLVDENYITQEQYTSAIKEKITLQTRTPIDKFPDYVTYVHDEFRELVATKEKLTGDELDNRIKQLWESGIRIYTALDPEKQQKAIETVNEDIPYKEVQAVTVMINNTTHEISAITGGKDYKKFEFHRAFQAYRQPGSAIKPLLVYAPYIETFDASPYTSINAADFCKKDYCPKNYSGHGYGTVTLKTALKYSFNTPAVRMMDDVGVKQAFSYLKKFQFAKIVPDDYRLPAAIGGFTYGITPLELTSAYTTFANNGIYVKSYAIEKVVDLEGNILYEPNKKGVRVWSENTNQVMRKLLTAVVQEGTARRANISKSYIGGKTGTTNDYKDLWFVGLDDSYTTGIWLGKDSPESIEYLSTASPHLNAWHDIMMDY